MQDDRYVKVLGSFTQRFAEVYRDCIKLGGAPSVPAPLANQLLFEACNEVGVTEDDYERAVQTNPKLRMLQKSCIGEVILSDLEGTIESKGAKHPDAPDVPKAWLVPRIAGPDDVSIYFARGVLCIEIGCFREAKICFDKMESISNGNWRAEGSAHFHRGCAYIKLGERQHAINDLKRARELAIVNGAPEIAQDVEYKLKEIGAA